MSRPHRRFTVAVAIGAAITLAAGIASWIVTFVDTDVTDIRALLLATSCTTVGTGLGVVWRAEERHDEATEHIEQVADSIVQRTADQVTLQLYRTLGNTIKEQIDAAGRLADAHRRWRQHVGTDTPIDLTRWKTGRAADGTPHS